MLLTSSGDRAAEEAGDGEPLAGGGLVAEAAVRAATIPGASSRPER